MLLPCLTMMMTTTTMMMMMMIAIIMISKMISRDVDIACGDTSDDGEHEPKHQHDHVETEHGDDEEGGECTADNGEDGHVDHELGHGGEHDADYHNDGKDVVYLVESMVMMLLDADEDKLEEEEDADGGDDDCDDEGDDVMVMIMLMMMKMKKKMLVMMITRGMRTLTTTAVPSSGQPAGGQQWQRCSLAYRISRFTLIVARTSAPGHHQVVHRPLLHTSRSRVLGDSSVYIYHGAADKRGKPFWPRSIVSLATTESTSPCIRCCTAQYQMR